MCSLMLQTSGARCCSKKEINKRDTQPPGNRSASRKLFGRTGAMCGPEYYKIPIISSVLPRFSRTFLRTNTVDNFRGRRRRSIKRYKGSDGTARYSRLPVHLFVLHERPRLGMDHHCSYRLGLSRGLMRMATAEIRLGRGRLSGTLNTGVVSSRPKYVLVTIDVRSL